MAINCLQLPSPHHVYSKLWERLVGQRLGPGRAQQALAARFAGEQRRGGGKTLVLLDEIDMLMTKDQAVRA